MALVETRPVKERRPGPYPKGRQCGNCGCILSRLNPSSFCAPCSGGDWVGGEPTAAEIRKLRAARLEEIGAEAA
jgi:hypothetical protein